MDFEKAIEFFHARQLSNGIKLRRTNYFPPQPPQFGIH